ncbi:hypothetical protein RGU74_13175 [Bacillus cereus]|uniref:hypothetical protein n=1 Tax=Bacillus cereus TaxID=1396 RepID=UPI002853724B|nr:hypothetical protein [Bacillus cereus]MDR4984618.1 hypothetical protein [Bacillus cereus]
MQDNQLRYFTKIAEQYNLDSIAEAQRFYKLFSSIKLLPESRRRELIDKALSRIEKGEPIVSKK